MAQVDWLPTMHDDLEDNEAIVTVVASGKNRKWKIQK
jgi:hypothetical protein